METSGYLIIRNIEQYNMYRAEYNKLVSIDIVKYRNEIDTLELLIKHWENENSLFEKLGRDPIELLECLMAENKLQSKDLVKILGLSKGQISKIRNRQKGLSKKSIRILATYFKLKQEAFNRPYNLVNNSNSVQEVFGANAYNSSL